MPGKDYIHCEDLLDLLIFCNLSMNNKKCTQCLKVKDILAFSPKGKDKFASKCKECKAQNRRDNYIKHSKSPITDGYKECKKCLNSKSVNDFYKNYNCKTFRNECKDCNNLTEKYKLLSMSTFEKLSRSEIDKEKRSKKSFKYLG